MRRERYLLSVSRAENRDERLLAYCGERAIPLDRFAWNGIEAHLARPDRTGTGDYLRPDRTRTGLVITEGGYSASEQSFASSPTGQFNLIRLDFAKETVSVKNDDFGFFPCYVLIIPGKRIAVSNSLYLIQAALGPAVDELGFVENFTLGWTIGNRTIFEDVHHVSPGTETVIDLETGRLSSTRHSRTWSHIIEKPKKAILADLSELWGQALSHMLERTEPPYGLMLSGGLDSRLVLGGLRGTEVIALTHGNMASEECRIARQAASIASIPLIESHMGSDFTFESLRVRDSHAMVDLIFNPIWWSSAEKLAGGGAATLLTGALGDVLLGGSYYYDSRNIHRARTNFRLALGIYRSAAQAASEAVEPLTSLVFRAAEKRARNYRHFLSPDYRDIVERRLVEVREEISRQIHDYLEEGTISREQALERFFAEHRDRKMVAGQELTLSHFRQVALPTFDHELVEYLTNLSPERKYDHHLYYPFFRMVAPDLARIEVPNLRSGVDVPQLLIEMRRVLNSLKKGKSTGWVNFNQWLRFKGNLEQFENLFYEQDGVFNPGSLKEYFNQVRRGDTVYDGNELFGFLNLAMFVNSKSI